MLKLKRFRKKANLTQDETAKLISISQNHLCDIENGKCANPSISILKKLSTLFGCTIDDLLQEEKEKA